MDFTKMFNDDFGSQDWKDKWGVDWLSNFENSEIIDNNLRISYIKDHFGVRQTGISFPIIFKRTYNELHFRYYLNFENGFDFKLGGKLPGLMGYDSYKCSGFGNQPNGSNGWTMRFMWREKGKIVVYAYLPKSHNGKYGGQKWGQDISCDTIVEYDKWYCLDQYINIGTPNKDDGELKVWINDELKIDMNDICYGYENNEYFKIGGIYFSTFHGGHDKEWAPRNDSYIQYKNL